MNIPQPGPAVPRSGGPISAALGRGVLRLFGWRIEGHFPDLAKGIVVVAPHTSNWDFVIGFSAKLALRLAIHWLGKDALFRGPAGTIFRAVGGIAVHRTAPEGFAAIVAARFNHAPRLLLAVTPEGTRRPVARWKSGFQRIALAAGVPLIPVALDYRTRTVRIHPQQQPRTNYTADLRTMAAHFHARMAKRPTCYRAPEIPREPLEKSVLRPRSVESAPAADR